MKTWVLGISRIERVLALLSAKTVSREAWLEIDARLKPLIRGTVPACEAVTVPMAIIE